MINERNRIKALDDLIKRIGEKEEADGTSKAIIEQYWKFADLRTGMIANDEGSAQIATSGFKITLNLQKNAAGNYVITVQKVPFANGGVAAGEMSIISVHPYKTELVDLGPRR
jgi:hypothetical protein